MKEIKMSGSYDISDIYADENYWFEIKFPKAKLSYKDVNLTKKKSLDELYKEFVVDGNDEKDKGKKYE